MILKLMKKIKIFYLLIKVIDNVEKIFSNAGILKNNNFYDPENLHLFIMLINH